MHARFDEYSKAVAGYVNHATGKEKASIRAELEAHMEDHAQALLDGGFPEEQAFRAAVEAMGDPSEVGKALNKEYPLRWLILSRLVWFLALFLAFLLVFTLAHGLKGVPGSLAARYAPMEHHHTEVQLPDAELFPLDFTQSFPNGDVLHIYAAAVEQDEEYAHLGSVGHLFAVTYNRNPLRAPLYYPYIIDCQTQGPEEDILVKLGGSSSGNAIYIHWTIHTVQPNETVTVQYDRYGTSFTLEVPLPWEEVAIP